MATQEQFVVDTNGRKTAIILSLKRYQKLMEDLHDLAVVAERRAERPISLASYKVTFKPSVEKDLRSLPQSVVTRIFKRIDALKENPFPRQSIKLAGAEQLYRVRIGDYRMIYGVDKNNRQVIVHYVRHRRDVYRQL